MRPVTLPAEFEHLTEEQLSQINQWLDRHSYKEVREKLRESFNIEITTDKLHRYLKKIEILNDLNQDLEDAQISVHEFYDLLNGRKVSTATGHLIDLRTFQLAMEPTKSVSRLLNLHRLATYRDRHDYSKQRLELNERIQAHKERKLENTLKMRAYQNGKSQQQPAATQRSASSIPAVAAKTAPQPDTDAWITQALSRRWPAVQTSSPLTEPPVAPNIVHFPSPLECYLAPGHARLPENIFVCPPDLVPPLEALHACAA